MREKLVFWACFFKALASKQLGISNTRGLEVIWSGGLVGKKIWVRDMGVGRKLEVGGEGRT